MGWALGRGWGWVRGRYTERERDPGRVTTREGEAGPAEDWGSQTQGWGLGGQAVGMAATAATAAAAAAADGALEEVTCEGDRGSGSHMRRSAWSHGLSATCTAVQREAGPQERVPCEKAQRGTGSCSARAHRTGGGGRGGGRGRGRGGGRGGFGEGGGGRLGGGGLGMLPAGGGRRGEGLCVNAYLQLRVGQQQPRVSAA